MAALTKRLSLTAQKVLENRKLSVWFFIAPYFLMFTVFIVLSVVAAFALSFTHFNTIEAPTFAGLQNYVDLFTSDQTFMQQVVPNTIRFALIVGPGGYILAFFLAWSLAQLPHKLRTILAIIIYSPSMTMGVAMVVVWGAFFSGDQAGYLNHMLLSLNLINEPIQWVHSPEHLMNIMIIVSLWSSMGVGFLAMLAGILNIDQTVFEAAYVDGLQNKFQEIFYITIPMMKPQMLFGAVMAIVSTFQAGMIGVQLSGQNPTPQNAGQLIVNHIEDFGFLRFEMGYAAAVSVMLLVLVAFIARTSKRVLREED